MEAWESEAEESRSKTKKRIGRPLAYTGNPDDPQLTDAERRRLRR